MTPFPGHIRDAITPLRLIFWGGLLWIFDLKFASTTNGEGFQFDVLNDTLATVLIAVGVFRLARLPCDGRCAAFMRFVKVVIVLSVVETAQAHFVGPRPEPVSFALTLLSLCQLAATVMFCAAMRRLCAQWALARAARSWRVTLILFVAIYAVPLGLFYLASLYAIATGESFNLQVGPFALLLLPVFAAPLVHLFVSTSRMRREIEQGGPAEAPTGGFPVVTPPTPATTR